MDSAPPQVDTCGQAVEQPGPRLPILPAWPCSCGLPSHRWALRRGTSPGPAAAAAGPHRQGLGSGTSLRTLAPWLLKLLPWCEDLGTRETPWAPALPEEMQRLAQAPGRLSSQPSPALWAGGSRFSGRPGRSWPGKALGRGGVWRAPSGLESKGEKQESEGTTSHLAGQTPAGFILGAKRPPPEASTGPLWPKKESSELGADSQPN